MKKALPILLAALCSSWLAMASADDVDGLLHQAVAGSWRSDANKARDPYRHPVETLEFFGLQPSMTVVELAPGGGWFTEILAPVLKGQGHLIEATGKTSGKYADMLQANKATFGDVKLEKFSPPKEVDLGPDGSADMMLTTCTTGSWIAPRPWIPFSRRPSRC
jgi:predicted methyltransferase